MARHEGRAEAGREGRFGLGHADFGASDLRRISREEVIHRLIGGQPRDRGQHAEGIGGQHDDVGGRRTEIVGAGIGDRAERIGPARVLGERIVVEIDLAIFVHHHVFEDRALHLRGGEDFGLGLGIEADHLGIAAAFEIEDRSVRPAMLVIADQRAAGIGRQRGLAGARQAEEHRALAVGADIGRAVHRHHAPGGKQVVEHAEHALFHLTGISGAADQDQLFFQIDRDHRFAAAAMAFGIGAEARQVDDRVFGIEPVEFIGSRPHQQRADELVVPGKFVDHAHLHAVLGLRSAEQVGDVERLPVPDRRQEILLQRGEMFGRHRGVVVPPDGVFGLAIADDEFVFRAAPGVLAGLDHQRTVLGPPALAIVERMLGQRGAIEIGVNICIGGDPLGGQGRGKRRTHEIFS